MGIINTSDDDEPKMSREEMKKEALERMELIGLPPYAKAAFKVDNYLTLSDISDKVCQSRVDGVPEDIMKEIKSFEEKFGALVFHVIHTKGYIWDLRYMTVYPYLPTSQIGTMSVT